MPKKAQVHFEVDQELSGQWKAFFALLPRGSGTQALKEVNNGELVPKDVESAIEHCFADVQFRGIDAEVQYADRKMLELEANAMLGVGKSKKQVVDRGRSSGAGRGKGKDAICTDGKKREVSKLCPVCGRIT